MKESMDLIFFPLMDKLKEVVVNEFLDSNSELS